LDGVAARGSMLLAKKTLRRLLTFAHPARRPQLAVVLVDEDGVADRRRTLSEWTADLDLPRVIGVPIREFEAWLIADPRACATVFVTTTRPPSPETMKPGEAKRMLQALHDAALPEGATQSERAQSVTTVRSNLAQRVDLALDGLSAWKQFRRDLENELAANL
jgi:hypothetical protein